MVFAFHFLAAVFLLSNPKGRWFNQTHSSLQPVQIATFSLEPGSLELCKPLIPQGLCSLCLH